MKTTPLSAKAFIGFMGATALAFVIVGGSHWAAPDYSRFLVLLMLSMISSRMRVSLPGVTSNMSVNLPFILLAVVYLALPEALVIAIASMSVQCLTREGRKFNPVQFVFNVSTMTTAVGLAHVAFGRASRLGDASTRSLLIAGAAAIFLVAQTLPVSVIIRLTEPGSVLKIWRNIVALTIPYFVLSSGVPAILVLATRFATWQSALAAFPVMYLIFCSYRRYFTANTPALARAAHA